MVRKRSPGDRIEGVFTIGDEPFIVMPATVVEDSGDRIAHYLARGTCYLRRQLLDGSDVPRVVGVDELAALGSRLAIAEWRSNQLVVTDPWSANGVRHRWANDTWEFEGWYVNLQRPLVRTETGFVTEDHFLDILVAPDGAWLWKDQDELELAVARGRVTPGEAAAIVAEGERMIAEIEARRFPFDGSLIDWRPDPAWAIPEVSDAWKAEIE